MYKTTVDETGSGNPWTGAGAGILSSLKYGRLINWHQKICCYENQPFRRFKRGAWVIGFLKKQARWREKHPYDVLKVGTFTNSLAKHGGFPTKIADFIPCAGYHLSVTKGGLWKPWADGSDGQPFFRWVESTSLRWWSFWEDIFQSGRLEAVGGGIWVIRIVIGIVYFFWGWINIPQTQIWVLFSPSLQNHHKRFLFRSQEIHHLESKLWLVLCGRDVH